MNANASTADHQPGGDEVPPDGAAFASPRMSPDVSPGARQRLGDFEILRELGRGGMGVVYEARQVSLNRKVALKVLSGGWSLTPKAVQRFRREAEAGETASHEHRARLRHGRTRRCTLLRDGADRRALARSRDPADAAHLIPTFRDRWYHHLLAFQCGSMDDETLLKKAGANRFSLCEAHFYIGLRRLAEGKRSEAKACFRRVMDTGAFLYEESIWSRAFLACIDDPAWMPSVPVNEHERKP